MLTRTLLLVAAVIASSVTLAQGNIEAGAEKASACNACHGSDGISINNLWPNLAAQKAGYLRKQITDFRDGRRVDPMMNTLVSQLSDEDIADIAAYYSSLSGIAKPIPKHL